MKLRFLFALSFLLFIENVHSADIQSGEVFADGQSFTAARANNAINGATILPAFLSGKSTGSPVAADSFLFYQDGTGTLLRCTYSTLQSANYASPTFTGTSTINGALAIQGILSPSQITSNQNNYSPTSLGSSCTIRINSDAARSITGLAGGTSGLFFIFHNTGSFNITFVDESASSTAANRFALVHDVVVPPDGILFLQYDSTSSRWRTGASHYHVAADITDYLTVNPSFTTLTDGATVTLTCSATKPSQNATVTLGGNRTLAISGATAGMQGILKVVQDGTGSRTLTLPAGSKVGGGGAGAVTLTTTAAAIDVLSWTYDGTNFFWLINKNFTWIDSYELAWAA